MSTRTEKIGSVLQKEISEFFAQTLDDYDYGLVTVTKVRVLEDLSEARISVSALKNQDDLVQMLNKRRGYIRRNLVPRLPIKRIPVFIFSVDTEMKKLQHIEDLLAQ